MKQTMLNAVAGVGVLIFGAIWVTVSIQLWRYDATATAPKLVVPDAVATVGGLLAGAVGVGTATVLGIKLPNTSTGDGDQSRAAVAASLLTRARLLAIGIGAYLGVGVVVLAAWLTNSAEAPDVVVAVGTGFVGWIVGALLAVFSADT